MVLTISSRSLYTLAMPRTSWGLLRKQIMTIEKITPFANGFFAMLVFENKPNEMTFDTEAEIFAYVAAFNALGA